MKKTLSKQADELWPFLAAKMIGRNATTRQSANVGTGTAILTALSTVDGAGSGLDTDLFDGMDSTWFVHGQNSTRTTSVSNFNALLDSGFYDGYTATGEPVAGANWFYVINATHYNSYSGNQYQFQIAHNFFADDMYHRRITLGSAGTWYKVADNGRDASFVNLTATATLSAAADLDYTHILGRARVGYVGFVDFAGFAHYDMASAGNYALLQDSTGNTFLNGALGSAVALRINNGNIAHYQAGFFYIDSAVTLQTANFAASQVGPGWQVTYEGFADFRYIYADELHIKLFIAELEQALAGGQIIGKSVAILYTDFLPPGAGLATNGTTRPHLVVENLPSAGALRVFADGDIVRLREYNRNSSGLIVADAWGTVTLDTSYGVSGFDSATKTQRYVFTRSSGSNAGHSSSTISKGSIVLDYGTTGTGFYEVNAVDGLYTATDGSTTTRYSPYAQIVTWTTHPATGQTLKLRIGNLSGISDANLSPSGYGIYTDNAYLRGVLEAGNGNFLIDSAGATITVTGDITWSMAGGFSNIALNDYQNYAFRDSVEYGGLAGGKATSRDRVMVYNQQQYVNKDAEIIIDARTVSHDTLGTPVYDRDATIYLVTSKWFPDSGVLNYAQIMIKSTNTAPTDYIQIDADAVIINSLTEIHALLDIWNDQFRVRTSKTPLTSGATGNTGTICWDTNYIYVATGTNTWKRAALSTF